MRNNIKITFRQPQYIINEHVGVVICKLEFSVDAPKAVNYASVGTINSSPYHFIQTAKAVSFAKDNDKFDVNVGKKVALAKAENKAYSYVKEWAKTAKKELSMCLDAIEDFEFKTERVKNHNVEYMKKF